MKSKISFIIVMIIFIAPVIYLGAVYHSLPQQVATHFSLDGQPTSYSGKGTFLLLVIFLLTLSTGVYFLLTNIHKIDPKKAANQSKETMHKIAFSIAVLLSCITFIIIYCAVNNRGSFTKFLLPLMGLFFAYLGNLLYSVKPNYFVGIRTPWALEDEDTWRKTHQLAGKLWFAGGIFIAIITIITPSKFAVIFMMIILAVLTIIPAVYSYRYYKIHKKTNL